MIYINILCSCITNEPNLQLWLSLHSLGRKLGQQLKHPPYLYMIHLSMTLQNYQTYLLRKWEDFDRIYAIQISRRFGGHQAIVD